MRRSFFRVIVLLLAAAQSLGMMAARRAHFASEVQALGHTDHLQAPGDDPCVPSPDDNCATCRLLNASAAIVGPHAIPQLHKVAKLDCGMRVADALPVHRLVVPLGSRPPPQL